MEFRITAEEALEMAKFEAEANCDISAGAEWGTHLDQVMTLALNQPMCRVPRFMSLIPRFVSCELSS
jgi:hypothetical protein